MFILLKSGAMLNLFWLQDCFQGKHEKNIVIFYLVNGVKLIEEYATEEEALARVQAVHDSMDKSGFCGDQECCVLTINGKVGDVVLKAGDLLTTQGISTQQSLDDINATLLTVKSDITNVSDRVDLCDTTIASLTAEIAKLSASVVWNEY